MKHTVKVHYSSAVFYLLKKTLGKTCGAIAPHRPNVDPSLMMGLNLKIKK